ncbi:MAG: calcium/sodium antiporter [Anaerolineae bacterium]
MDNIILIILGLVALYFGGEWLIRASSRLASALGIPTLLVGLTVVAFGTSAPELVVSVSAATQGVSDISLGNVVGSNIANIGLILGLAGLILPLTIEVSMISVRDTDNDRHFVVHGAAGLDGTISQFDGLLLFGGYLLFTFVLYRLSRRSKANGHYSEEVAAVEGNPPRISLSKEGLRLVAGLVMLVAGAQGMVAGATSIARSFGVSELLIGLTLVAVGTSLPEIATSVLAVRRGHTDIAVGNAVGSNIANLLAVLGLTAVIRPVPVDPALLRFEIPVMIVFAVVSLILMLDRQLARWQAALLLAGYAVFIVCMVLRA